MKRFEDRATSSARILKWSAPALEDRDTIFDYIEVDSPTAAMGVDQRIRECVERLRRFPEMGRPGRIEGTRELMILRTPYIAAYRVADGVVTILGIIHGAQQWPEEF